MDSRDIQKKNELEYQRKQDKFVPPPLLRIGEYHPQTGRYEVLFPNGGKAIAGNKLFNSSTPTGTPVRATQAFGSQVIGLDYRNHQPIPLPIQEVLNSELADTYIVCLLDTSGSMNNELPAIRETLSQLRNQLKEEVYGSEDKVNQYFIIKDESNERWVDWFTEDPRIEKAEPNKVVVLGFINESDSVYHQIPRRLDLEPTSSFTADRNIFILSYQERDFFKGRIFSVQYPSQPILEESFSSHVRDAVEGFPPYPTPGLKDFDCSYILGIPASTSTEFYLQNIKELLGL